MLVRGLGWVDASCCYYIRILYYYKHINIIPTNNESWPKRLRRLLQRYMQADSVIVVGDSGTGKTNMIQTYDKGITNKYNRSTSKSYNSYSGNLILFKSHENRQFTSCEDANMGYCRSLTISICDNVVSIFK